MPILIEELYSSKECKTIRDLHKNDESSRNIIREAIGNKIILDNNKILTSRPLDVLCLICLTSKFASSDDECYRVAITVYQHFDKVHDFLPYITNQEGLAFASKTLAALSFAYKAMEKRWQRHGAPKPEHYRKASKLTFLRHGQKDLAAHHEKWEGFLGELLV